MLRSNSVESLSRGIPADIGDGWHCAAPAELGIEGTRLSAMIKWLDGLPGANIHAVLVARRGALAFEHYRNGADQLWNQYLSDVEHGPTTRHDMRSVTKSIVSLLFGIALDRKLIGLDDSIFNRLPEYVDLCTEEKAGISLRHLLTMAAGLEWNEYIPYTDPNNSEIAMLRSGDRLRFALQPRLVSRPGSEWTYSGGCSELLGAVISRAAGQPIEEFAMAELFAPLGISDVGWGRYPDQIPSAAGGLQMRPRDLAKLGQLVLQRGFWDGRPIVTEAWIKESTSPQIGPADRLQFYGYHWWLGRSLIDGREIRWVAAEGNGGQRLFIVPAMQLVCVVTAGHYDDAMQVWLPLLLFNRYMLPAAL